MHNGLIPLHPKKEKKRKGERQQKSRLELINSNPKESRWKLFMPLLPLIELICIFL